MDFAPVTEISTDASLASGVVVDGPVTRAQVSVVDAQGNTVATTLSRDDASYDVSVPQGTMYPVTITTHGGRDFVTQSEPIFPMTSVKLSSDAGVSNLTPFSTLVVKMAQAMQGGVNRENLALASGTVFEQFGFGLDRALMPDPVGSEISANNVAAIIKASEALAETIRRARDNLLIAGSTIDAEQILDAVAADMAADGVLDGRGANADPRIAATVTVASAAVLIETLSNNLTINGVNVADSMDAGILLASPTSAGTTGDVSIIEPMLVQARTAVTAAQSLATDAAIADVMIALNGLSVGSTAADIQPVLPPESAHAFDAVLTNVVLGTSAQLEGVNQSIRQGTVADTGTDQTATTPTQGSDGITDGTTTPGSGMDTGANVSPPADTSGSGTSGSGSTGSDTAGTGNSGNGTTGSGTIGGGSSVDTQAPVITLLGSTPVTIESGQTYVEAGASALDDVDGDLSANIVITSQVNSSAAGRYTVTYSVSDSSGNGSTVARSVEVVDPIMMSGSFELGSAAYTVDEGDGKVDIEVRRIGGSDGSVTVDWRTRTLNGYGTADFSTDYVSVMWQPLAFSDSETSKVISVAINQDALAEGDETFSIMLQNPTGGSTLGNITTAIVMIADDDASGGQVETPVPPLRSAYPPEATLTNVTAPNVAKPAYLVPITDPGFGTKVTRITDNVVFGQNDVSNPYSKVQPWNKDGSLILVRRWILDGNTYQIKRTINVSGETRWSHTDPNKIYNAPGGTDNRFMNINASTGEKTVLHTFTGYNRCFIGPWQGNLSVDDRYIALACNKAGETGDDASWPRHAIIYDIQTDTIVAEKTHDRNIKWISMSQSGKYVVIRWWNGTGPKIQSFDKQLNLVSTLVNETSHGDITYDSAGDEVYVQYEGIGKITSYRLSDGKAMSQLDRNGMDNGHLSCRNVAQPGWCTLSVYEYPGNFPGSEEVFSLKLDGSQTVRRFAHHHSTAGRNDTTAAPEGVVSPDGTKVMFTSNWGGGEISSYVAEMP